MAPINQDCKLNSSSTTMLGEGIQSCSNGSARVENIINKYYIQTFNAGIGDLGWEQRFRAPSAKIVAIKGCIEGPMIDRTTL
jgi:hypothetical protein